MSNYWQKQLSRRRALKAAALAGGGAAAIALIGCGGGDDGGGGVKGDASGLLSEPEDTTSKATRGGIYAEQEDVDWTTLDHIFLPRTPGELGYSYMVRNKMVKYPDKYEGEKEPDAMASWEVSNDGLQYTFKVRPNMKLDPRPPTNNRVLDAEDVVASWEFFAAQGNSKTTLAKVAAADAPVESMTAPDSRTVVVKLAYPYAALLAMLEYDRGMAIMPKEARREGAGGYDVRNDIRGSGPFRLVERRQSVSAKFERNPDWYDADKVFLDGIEIFIIPEYATQMAQFRAGALWEMSAGDLKREDVLSTKRENMALIMQPGDEYAVAPQPMIGLGSLPGMPFADERVRRALSMLIDRDLYLTTFENIEQFTREGLPVEARWNSHVTAGYEEWWIDPKSAEIGEGRKNFEYNPTEAKALLRAAGHTRAIETVLNFSLNAYGSDFNNKCETLRQMWEANGDFKLRLNNPDYRAEWLNPSNGNKTSWNGGYHFGEGTYEGIMLGSGNGYPEVDGHLQAWLRKGSIRVWRAYEDAHLDNLVDRQRQELDREKRYAIIKEIQQHAAKTIPGLAAVGSTPGFSLAQPWVGNRGLWRRTTNSGHSHMHIYYDKSKAKA